MGSKVSVVTFSISSGCESNEEVLLRFISEEKKNPENINYSLSVVWMEAVCVWCNLCCMFRGQSNICQKVLGRFSKTVVTKLFTPKGLFSNYL